MDEKELLLKVAEYQGWPDCKVLSTGRLVAPNGIELPDFLWDLGVAVQLLYSLPDPIWFVLRSFECSDNFGCTICRPYDEGIEGWVHVESFSLARAATEAYCEAMDKLTEEAKKNG